MLNKKEVRKRPKQKIKIRLDVHNPTKETLKKLKENIVKEKDEKKLIDAQLAYEEAEMFYYSPSNEQQEKELILAKIISERKERLSDLDSMLESAKFNLEKLDLELEVHQSLLKKQTPAQAEEWKYNFSEDYYIADKNRLHELSDEIAYEMAWIKQAQKMIKTEKFKNLPMGFFSRFHFDYEDVDFWGEGNDDCGEDCPRCTSI